MSDKDPDGPSLELPSFGFGRKRKQKVAAEPEAEPNVPVSAGAEPAPPAPETATQALDPIAPPPAATATPTAQLPEDQPDSAQRTTPLLGLGALPASLVTGVVVGLLTALLGYGSQRLCEAVRSTSSCGGAGFLMLLAILVAMTLLGSVLLRAFLVPDAGSASVMAMGLLAVLVMLFLMDAAFSPAMFVVIPLLAAGCYAAAHWVTLASTAKD